MQIIHDSKAIFNVYINPFEKTILVRKGWSEDSYLYTYKDNDEWFSREFDGIKYDFHFLYDVNALSFCVYQVNTENEVDYTSKTPINLHVEIGT